MTHLDHVDEVVEKLFVVDGKLVVSKDDTIVKHVLSEAEAEHEIAGVPYGLAHQEQAVFHGPEFADSLRARYLSMKPAEES